MKVAFFYLALVCTYTCDIRAYMKLKKKGIHMHHSVYSHIRLYTISFSSPQKP